MEKGQQVYRSNCAFCHGLTGLGGRGPNLATGIQKLDEQIIEIVKNGIPGSTMPAFEGFDADELNALVAFLRHLEGSAPAKEKVNGNATNGRAVYQKKGCGNCHLVGEQGSAYGPDLTRIGGARSLHYLEQSIVDPSEDIADRYDGVVVVTKDGKRISGIRVNEDTFSVQLRLPSQAYRSFLKDEVKEVIPQVKSLMPAYKSLPRKDLDDLIAYLSTLRGDTMKGAKTKAAEGIR
jgi:putative heme-binding domain-containing protein